jgi:hypothetical protein
MAGRYARNMESERHERVFIVRMWRQRSAGDDATEHDGAPGETVWRGSIRDVISERTRYVANAREVAEYIAIVLAEEQRR